MTPDEFGSFSAYAAFQTIMIAVFGLESFLTLNRARFDFGELDLMKYQFSVLVPVSYTHLTLPTIYSV